MLLNPLKQRLFLYCFATVRISPREPLQPKLWGLANLQHLLHNRAVTEWEALLQACRPFQWRHQAPVISPSIRELCRLRAAQPRRPLILCRTLGEHFPKNIPLHKLARRNQTLCRMVDLRDPLHPLDWTPIFLSTNPNLQWLEAYNTEHGHPGTLAMALLRKNISHGFVDITEDGAFVIQENLFRQDPVVSLDDLFGVQRQALGQALQEALRRFPGHSYVTASMERLQWFRRDCLRYGGPFVQCLDYPQHPHPKDPQTTFILINNQQMRFARLEARPLLCADHVLRLCDYRAARLPARSPPQWVERRQPLGQACLRLEGRDLQFIKTSSGWWSRAGPVHAPNRSGDFHQRLAALQWLNPALEPALRESGGGA